MNQMRRVAVFWAESWLLILLVTEALHGVVHKNVGSSGDIGTCVVCLLHQSPTPPVPHNEASEAAKAIFTNSAEKSLLFSSISDATQKAASPAL
jgi:hypothetical protein